MLATMLAINAHQIKLIVITTYYQCFVAIASAKGTKTYESIVGKETLTWKQCARP